MLDTLEVEEGTSLDVLDVVLEKTSLDVLDGTSLDMLLDEDVAEELISIDEAGVELDDEDEPEEVLGVG